MTKKKKATSLIYHLVHYAVYWVNLLSSSPDPLSLTLFSLALSLSFSLSDLVAVIIIK